MKGLLLFLTGAAVGAATTALVTTEKGEEVRRRIKEMLVKKGIIADDQVEDFVEMIASQIEEN